MGSFERSKKRIQVWKKALFHFSLCFVMGFFTGFAPTNTSSIFTNTNLATPSPIQSPAEAPDTGHVNRSLMAEAPTTEVSGSKPEMGLGPESDRDSVSDPDPELIPRPLLIIITPTRANDPLQGPLLRRLGYTLKLIPPPVVWIVVEPQSDTGEMNEMLRKTGIMYRHLVSKENFTNDRAQADHQRNVALNHIEHHRLDGIVHFAGVRNVYDLHFFESIRDIEVFGTWPMALMSPNKRKVIIEGPICSSSQVTGWHLKKANDEDNSRLSIPISSFAFNSSILWDPERWGRASSVQDTSQDSLEFVKQVVLEDESKLMGIPQGCSKIMLWRLLIGGTRSRQMQP